MPSGPNRDSQLATHSTPRPAASPCASPLLPRAFRVPSAVFCVRSRVALSLAIRVSVCAPPPSRPFSRDAPLPFSACSPQLPCVLLLLPRLSAFSVLPRAFAMCCCAALSHAPNLAARAPRAAPCRTCVTSRSFASAAALFRASLHCCCCCGARAHFPFAYLVPL